MKDPAIQFENVSFRYDVDEPSRLILENFDLTLYEGEFTCILGHNGSGKSTVAKLCNALLLPTEGKVLAFGLDSSVEENENEIRRLVGMVFQNPDNQLVATIVEDDVAFGPENLGLPREEIRRRVDDALAAVGMGEFPTHAPHLLSGGQKQRIAIAGVIAMEPETIVLDEATAMLDPKGREELLSTVRELNKKNGMTVVMITQYMEEAVMADRLIVMSDGQIVMDDTPQQIFTRGSELRTLGLDVPEIVRIREDLQKAGVSLPLTALTDSQLAEALCPLF
jgi:energy-coupling factor transport system ATP-binding protein